MSSEIALLSLSDPNIETGRTDEEIITNSNYDFAKDVNKLIMNSNETRRAEKFDKGKITDPPRPLNSFFIYMKVMRNKIIKTNRKKMHSKHISKLIGKLWRVEPENTKEFFKICARVAKKEHGKIYKDYQYKRRIPQKKLVNHNEENELEQVENLAESLDQDNLPRNEDNDAQLSTVIAPTCNLSEQYVNELNQLNQMFFSIPVQGQIESSIINTGHQFFSTLVPPVPNYPPIEQSIMNTGHQSFSTSALATLPSESIVSGSICDLLNLLEINSNEPDNSPENVTNLYEQPYEYILLAVPKQHHTQ